MVVGIPGYPFHFFISSCWADRFPWGLPRQQGDTRVPISAEGVMNIDGFVKKNILSKGNVCCWGKTKVFLFTKSVDCGLLYFHRRIWKKIHQKLAISTSATISKPQKFRCQPGLTSTNHPPTRHLWDSLCGPTCSSSTDAGASVSRLCLIGIWCVFRELHVFFVPSRRGPNLWCWIFLRCCIHANGVKLSHCSHLSPKNWGIENPGLKKHAGTIFSASPLMISFRGLEKLRLQIDDDLGLSLEVVVTISKTAGSFWRMINSY